MKVQFRIHQGREAEYLVSTSICYTVCYFIHVHTEDGKHNVSNPLHNNDAHILAESGATSGKRSYMQNI